MEPHDFPVEQQSIWSKNAEPKLNSSTSLLQPSQTIDGTLSKQNAPMVDKVILQNQEASNGKNESSPIFDGVIETHIKTKNIVSPSVHSTVIQQSVTTSQKPKTVLPVSNTPSRIVDNGGKESLSC